MRRRGGADRWRQAARALAALGVGLLVLGVAIHPSVPSVGYPVRAFANGGGGGGSSGGANVALNVSDTGFDPTSITVDAGTTVHFTITNVGQDNHTFTLATIGNFSFPSGTTPSTLVAFFAHNGSLLNLSVAPGTNASGNVSLPSSDAGVSFEFVSWLPYQFQAGLFGFVHVTYSTTAASYTLETNTTDGLAFVPSELVIPTAASFPISVSVEVVNVGSNEHTFTLDAQGNNTLLTSNYSSYFASHPPLVDVPVAPTSGSVVWANFTITGKGAYEFICAISGHFAHGMFGWLYVGYAPAPPPSPPSTALVDVAFLIGGGAVLALALLLTVVATFIGRFPPAPPKSGHG